MLKTIQASQTALHQTLTLRDGRTLGYAEYGSSTGFPLLYFHGFPSSRLEGWGFDKYPQRHGFRLIVPDRPGFGLSSFQPNRSITDWPADVQALTSHLGLSQFAILGGSGGGPYAIACAHQLPSRMLSAVGVVAGAPPWIAGTEDVTMSRKITAVAATSFPSALETVSDLLVMVLRRVATTGPVERWLDNWIDSMRREKENQSEQKETSEVNLSTREARERMIRTSLEAFAQGSAAFVQEARLLTQDWGFRFEDMAYPGIRIWHGTKDVNAPISMIRFMAERLPQSVLHEVDEDHYNMGHYLEEIISDLISKRADKRMGT
ncbi:Alpha/Beta hydrolase protein [Aspergillus ambiguus]|uniref:alpha/beta fold hydrolase n=1 Tax=Aspergillus ambiguus TaxID=176160 RepID=UPI003CCD3888